MAEDLRGYLDVEEGLRCLIWGKPDQIPSNKINFYLAYAKDDGKDKEDGKDKDDAKENDEFFKVERIVDEFSTLK